MICFPLRWLKLILINNYSFFVIKKPCSTQRLDIEGSESYQQGLEKLKKEFEKNNSERNLANSKSWKPPQSCLEIDGTDDCTNVSIGVNFLSTQSAWSIPCLKEVHSLWLRYGSRTSHIAIRSRQKIKRGILSYIYLRKKFYLNLI